MTQKLYGYRLTAPEENTKGDWSFYNQDKLVACALKRKNGSIYTFTGEAALLERWAADRDLMVSECVFLFNDDLMTFTQE